MCVCARVFEYFTSLQRWAEGVSAVGISFCLPKAFAVRKGPPNVPFCRLSAEGATFKRGCRLWYAAVELRCDSCMGGWHRRSRASIGMQWVRYLNARNFIIISFSLSTPTTEARVRRSRSRGLVELAHPPRECHYTWNGIDSE